MKSLILTLVAFLLILVTLNAGYYPTWFRSKPVGYWNDLMKEINDTLDPSGIMKSRYGVSYLISMKVKEVMEKKGVSHPVILFEPNSYYRDSLHIYPNVRAPEPAVFYYYTGLEGVWVNSPDVERATYLVRVSKKGVTLEGIHSQEQLRQLLTFYRRFTPIL